MSDTELFKQLEGSSVDDALRVFVQACKKASPDTLFITDHWIEPRLRQLRALLSDPITSEQASALFDAIEKRVELDIVIAWLTNSAQPLSAFVEAQRKAEAARENFERERKRQQMIEDARTRLGTFEGRMIAGCPISIIPDSVRAYPDFLTWWREVGRLKPEDPQGWSSISGRGVMWTRSEMIAPEVWNSLPRAERRLIEKWAQTIPIGILVD